MDFRHLIEELKPARTLADYIAALSKRPIYIYGAGAFGRELLRVFRNHNAAVAGLIDRQGEDIIDAPAEVYLPEVVENKAEITVVIGIVMDKLSRENLESTLRELGYTNIIDGQSVRAHYVYALEKEADNCPREYYDRHMGDIEAAYNLLADDESRDTYVSNLTAHLKRDYSHYAQTNAPEQYFAPNVPLNKGFSRFIDCGGYIGDTIDMLCKYQEPIEAVAVFEPDMENFTQLTHNYNKRLCAKIGEGYLFPCGAYKCTTQLFFTPAAGSGTIVADKSEQTVTIQAVALDDALQGFRPTYLKMDIEGAEYDAILGAKRIIKQDSPDLAISVYHIIDDYYRLPLLIKELSPNYRFYLRSHSSCTMETILYATMPREGK